MFVVCGGLKTAKVAVIETIKSNQLKALSSMKLVMNIPEKIKNGGSLPEAAEM